MTAARTTLVVAGETLGRATWENVGHSKAATEALLVRLKDRKVPGHINLVYPRIPQTHMTDGGRAPSVPLNDLRASALVDVQLVADADLIIPPIPSGIDSQRTFDMAMERTVVGIQTFHKSKEIVGYIPSTEHLEIVRDMIHTYAKRGVRFFAVDFSGASNMPILMRTVIRTIRESLRIRRSAKEKDEKYYLHVFNVAASRKSTSEVAPISDIITHPYGVDSTSGVMWGGGELDVNKLRYYNTVDYGSYRRSALHGRNLSCSCPTCKSRSVGEIYAGSPSAVLERLRTHRLFAYIGECSTISQRIAAGQPSESYQPYLMTKTAAQHDITKILRDVREVRANL